MISHCSLARMSPTALSMVRDWSGRIGDLPGNSDGKKKKKNLPAMWETKVQSSGLEDLLEKEIATHSSILAWRIPWTEESGGLQSMGSHRVGHAE